jgi:2'-5' RNA ligase
VTRLQRAFLAVVPPEEALDDLEGRVEPLRAGAPRLRWLPRQQWHLTVQFLGPVEDAETLLDAVGAAVARLPPFPLQLGGGGAFPSARRAAVLWVGVDEPGPLVALAEAVQERIAGLGHPPGERRYHPHVTVARAARPRPVAALVRRLEAAAPGPAWTVTDVALVESDTRPEGAVYTEYSCRALGG